MGRSQEGGWLGRFRGFVEVKRSWSGAALGLGNVGLEFGDVLAGDERGLARIDPPAFGEAADVHRVEAEFVVEPGHQFLGRRVVSGEGERPAARVATGGTSKLVDRIEASGYCRRLPNPDDRRSSLLELTPAGQRILVEAGVAFDEELQRWLGAPVPERTLRQFAATLTRLRTASRRIDMEDSA